MPDEPTAPSPARLPDDAGDTRGAHLRQLLVHPATLILGGLAIAGAGVGGGIAAGPVIGMAAAGTALLLCLIVVWLIAASQATQDFFRAYATGRGLQWTSGKTPVPPATPLLRKGDNRYAEELFTGTLPGGSVGSLCLFTVEEQERDSDGTTTTTYVHYTVAMCDVPEVAPFVAELDCQRRVGLRALDHAEDVFRTRQRVETESEALDKRYEIFSGKQDDPNRVRQIFDPSFIVWLAEQAPDEFAFELNAGALVANVKGHRKSAAELDALCRAACKVAGRLRAEAGE
jgi:hypothetical protein